MTIYVGIGNHGNTDYVNAPKYSVYIADFHLKQLGATKCVHQ